MSPLGRFQLFNNGPSVGGHDVERAVELFLAVGLLGVGLSHLFQPLAWIEFFAWLRAQGRPGVFLDGLLNLTFGAFIVAFHNIWHGPPLVITILGCAMFLKGLQRLLAPQLALRLYARILPEHSWHFQVAGAFSLVLSAFSAYLAIST